MTPLRVVFLTHNYPRFSGDLAGAFLHPLALGLRERGHDVQVVAPSDGGLGGRDRLDGIPISRVRYGSTTRERYAYTGRMAEMLATPGGWVALWRLLAGMRREVRRLVEGPTVVHAHWWFPAGVAAPPEVPTVVTLHGTDARLLDGAAARWLARRALREDRVLTGVSQSVADLARASLGMSIDASKISPMPVMGEPRRSAGGRGLVVVGRLTSQKRVDLAIDALAVLDPETRLTVVGDGPALSELRARARRIGVDERIAWVGRVPSEQVAGWLADGDALLLPARQEGLGLVAVEALLAGVPIVVCADGGGLVEVASLGGGRVAAPTVEALAAAVREVLGSSEARDAAYRAGVEWARRLAPAAVAERVEVWYREALGAAR